MKRKTSGCSAVVTLLLITAVMAGLLALVNSVTAGPIAAAQREKTEQALSCVLQPGVQLGETLTAFPDETGLVQAVYETSDGYVVEVAPSGYGGELLMVVGIDGSCAVTGIQIVSHSETASLGANAAADNAAGRSFREQFLGATGTLSVTKDGGAIDALTGATMTSRAVTQGVNAALACAEALEGGNTKHPVLAQLLGMCSTMAITTTLFNGLGMGLSVTLILICSNVLISLLRKVIPGSIRIAAYVVIISGFVTMVDLLLQAFLPALSEGLGVFIPLIVVNCIILGRAEAFASKNGVLASAADGLTQGLGYTVALVVMCIIRELLGSGTFGAGLLNGGEGIRILPNPYPAMLLILPFGGFLTLGVLIAFSQWLTKTLDRRQRAREAEKRKEAAVK